MEEDEALKLASRCSTAAWTLPRSSMPARGDEGRRRPLRHKEYFLPELIVGGDILKQIGES